MDCLQNLVLLLVADRDIPRFSQAAGRVVDRAAQDRVARDRAADRAAGKAAGKAAEDRIADRVVEDKAADRPADRAAGKAVGRKAEDKAAGSIADSRKNSGNAASKGSDH